MHKQRSINFGEQNFHGFVRLAAKWKHSEPAGRNRSVSGQDRKFPPAHGTNQIARFREFPALKSQEKKLTIYKIILPWQLTPLKSPVHLQWYFVISSTSLLQAAPFKQGLLSHGSVWTREQNTTNIIWVAFFDVLSHMRGTKISLFCAYKENHFILVNLQDNSFKKGFLF